jgi:hypothetical protein
MTGPSSTVHADRTVRSVDCLNPPVPQSDGDPAPSEPEDCGRPFCDLRELGVEHGHRGDRRRPAYILPTSDWNKPDPPLPDCRRKMRAIGLLLAAGAVFGAVLALLISEWVS